MLPESSLLICTSPRSGSNWLCDMIGKTGQVGRPGEYFSVSGDRLYERQLGPGALACYPKVFDYILRLGSTPNRRFATKLFWLQLRELEAYFRNCGEYENDDGLAILEDQLPNISVLRLLREDYLRQAISHHRALNTQVWWNNEHISVPRELECKFDYEAIRSLLVMQAGWERSWTERLRTYEHPQLFVTYDELRGDTVGTLRRVLAFLDVEAEPQFLMNETKFRMQADALTDAWVRRFLEEDAGRSSIDIGCDLSEELSSEDRPTAVQAHCKSSSIGPTVGSALR